MNCSNFPLLILILSLESIVSCSRPAVVNIGAILTYDSVIGRVAKVAIEAAVADINADKSILDGTQLSLIMEDSSCNSFLGAVQVLKVLEKDAVIIIGPQSSTTARMISFISSELQVPLVSFAATDPTLSSLQFPFFLRMTQSDSYQMEAMADFINHYRWKQVIAVYVDNEYGRNGVNSLDDELSQKMSIVYKIALPIGASHDYMMDALHSSKVIGPRVYVVHASPDSGLEIFSVAQQLNMMTDEYVWLVTDWLCTALSTSESFNSSLSYLQGVVGLCQYIPPSSQNSVLLSKWSKLQEKEAATSMLNAYAFYAYDTVWAVARALSDFFDDSGSITFNSNDNQIDMKGNLQLNKLRTFKEGNLLLQKLLLLNFTGLVGEIQFDDDHNLKSGRYQIINIHGKVIYTVGYWHNQIGLSVSLPNSSYRNGHRNFSESQILGDITWPSGQTKTPRGWVIATAEKPLQIAVPYRVSFTEFVTATDNNHSVKGYCIDVFEAALKLVPYDVPHQFVPVGDGHLTPSYWHIVNMVSDGVVDAAVGDISIVKNRTRIVDFTQPYTSSALVVVVPVRSIESNAWVFLRPFSTDMWVVTGAFFLLIGIVIWILEHRVNSDFRGPPKRQCTTIILFSFSSLFHAEQEDTLSTLGRFVMVVWSFLLLVLTSSYTASLTSFLTIRQLYTPINGIDSLIATNQPIGFQQGSFARIYMIDTLKVNPSRLIPYNSPEAYADALRRGPNNGGVAAIVDELPYIDLFLQNSSGFAIVGQPFTRSGWGFAFPRGSPLAVDLSSAILKLSENGELNKIHDKWFCKSSGCTVERASRDPNQLHLSSFLGLFLICGVATVVSLAIFLFRAIRQYVRYNQRRRDPDAPSSRGCSQMIYNFFDFIDEKEEAIKNMFKQQNHSSQLQVAILRRTSIPLTLILPLTTSSTLSS